MFKIEGYQEIFNRRGKEYHLAMEQYSDARKYEFMNLLKFVELNKNSKILDIPSGGGYLRKYLPENFHIVCAEETEYFYTTCKESFNQEKIMYQNDRQLNLADAMFDLVISVAGLHHLETKNWIVSEMTRILKDQGEIIIADVQENSLEAKFLNEFVDSNNSYGHKGIFLNNEFENLLEAHGFKLKFNDIIKYHWEFDSIENMLFYCKNLFGIDKCGYSEILAAIQHYLGYTIENNIVKMNWSLKYINAVKNSKNLNLML